jgi:hypothetical protein
MPPAARVDPSTLDAYVGYYHDANPRNQVAWPLQTLLAGKSVTRDGELLYVTDIFGASQRLIPVSENTFRLENEIDASRVFTRDAAGTIVMTGGGVYAERRPRWRSDLARVAAVCTLGAIISVFAVAIVWVGRLKRATPHGFWMLKAALLACPLILIAPGGALALTPTRAWGTANVGTVAVFIATLMVPAMAGLVTALALAAQRAQASRWLVAYALVIAYAMAGVTVYLAAYDLIGLRLWRY